MNQELINFIYQRTGVKVTDQTVFFDDLGIDGLDISTFFNDFFETFGIDGTNLDISHYLIERKHSFLNIFKKKHIKHFDLKHLDSVIQKKEWFDPF